MCKLLGEPVKSSILQGGFVAGEGQWNQEGYSYMSAKGAMITISDSFNIAKEKDMKIEFW